MTQALILFLSNSTGNDWILSDKYKWPPWFINLYMVLRPTILVFFSLNMIHLVYNLRNSENKLAVSLPRTTFLKNNFSYNGAISGTACPLNCGKQNRFNFFEMVVAISSSETTKRTRHLCKADFLYSHYFLF